MDPHIEKLFRDAQPFDEGELYQDPGYNRCFSENLLLERLMKKRFGLEAYDLLLKFLDSYYEIERYNCLHYFYQGYLTGKEKTAFPAADEKG